ncbi:hypothetical protein [Terrabacter terrigena]|uniref:Secreted protein n=1 Tax=Terrabacter terrigena TaxID=574718 RepID=A0ABW3N2W4_9MICO
MTTRSLSLTSLTSLRSFAASARRGHLAGSSGSFSLTADRDLDRVAGDLLAVAHADPERLSAVPAAALATPVDLGARRARSTSGTSAPRASAPHAQAS